MKPTMNKIYFFKIFFLSFAFCFLSNFYLCAQSTISSAGGQGLSSSGKVDYTIGQIGYTNYSTSSGKINEGVQQPFEILILKLESSEGFALPEVFPNPSYDKVFIRFNSLDKPMFYELINQDGKVQLSDKINDAQTELKINELTENIYFLKVFSSNNKFTTFKLIKLNKS